MRQGFFPKPCGRGRLRDTVEVLPVCVRWPRGEPGEHAMTVTLLSQSCSCCLDETISSTRIERMRLAESQACLEHRPDQKPKLLLFLLHQPTRCCHHNLIWKRQSRHSRLQFLASKYAAKRQNISLVVPWLEAEPENSCQKCRRLALVDSQLEHVLHVTLEKSLPLTSQ